MLVTRMPSSSSQQLPSPGPPPSDGLPAPPAGSQGGYHPSSSSQPPNSARSPSTSSTHHTQQRDNGRSPISTSHPAHMGSLRRRQDELGREAELGGGPIQGGSLSSRHHPNPYASSSLSSGSHRAEQPRSYSGGTSQHLYRPSSPPPSGQHAYAAGPSQPASSSSRRSDHSLNPHSASSNHPSSSSHPHSSRSTSSSNPNHVRSKHLLSHALELAQRAVDLDQAMRFPEALALYKETVLRLGEVMARVAATERRRMERDGETGGSSNPDEGRSLREIHDAYRARIVLLESEIPPSPTPTITQQRPLDDGSDPARNGVESRITSLYERTDPDAAVAFQGPRTTRPPDETAGLSSPSHHAGPSAVTSGLRRMDSASSESSSRSHSRTHSLSQPTPRVEVEQPTPRPRAASRSIYRSPLPPPVAPPPPPPPLPTSNRFSGSGVSAFAPSHSPHSSNSSLTNGADPSASSGSQPPTPSTYGGHPRGSPPVDVNGSPRDAEYVAQVRRQSLLESLRAGEEDGGIAFTSISKSTSDKSLSGSIRNRPHQLEEVRESPERSLVHRTRMDDREPRSSEDTESGVEMLSRTPLQAGFPPRETRTKQDPSAVPSVGYDHTPRRSVDSTRSNESRGSRLGRSMNAQLSPRASVDNDAKRPTIPPRSSSSSTLAPEDDSLISPKTIPGQSGPQIVTSAEGRPILMNATDEGTISQRRKAPTGTDSSLAPLGAAVDYSDSTLRADTLPIQRSSSAEPHAPFNGPRTTEFGVGAGVGGGPVAGSHSKASSLSTRLRALSQPGRRPAMQSNLSSSSGETPRQAPPVPSISRKASFPSQPPPSATTSTANYSAAFSLSRQPSISSDTSRSAYNRLNPPPSLAITRSFSSSSSVMSHQPRSAVPSVGGQSAFLSASTVHTGLNSPQPPLAPEDVLHRPFHLLGLIRLTMHDKGAYLTRKMFVARDVWTQGGSKLLHLDTKIQVLQTLSNHLEATATIGQSLLADDEHSDAAAQNGEKTQGGTKNPSPAQVAVDFVKFLDELETTMDVGRTTLEKKVGSLGPMKAKAKGAASLAAWGSKLTRSFEQRLGNSKNDGSLRAYVDALETLCQTCQFLDLHLKNFTSSSSSSSSITPNPSRPSPPSSFDGGLSPAYRQIPDPIRTQIRTRLVTISQFFGQVIVTVVLRDLGLLLEKHAKTQGEFIRGP